MHNFATVVRVASFTIVALAARAQPARAHFLFIRITPPAEGGRAAEVYFSERATAGDPRFVENVAHTKLGRRGVFGFRSTNCLPEAAKKPYNRRVGRRL